MAEGELDYHLPDQTLHFGVGSGGLLLPNVLHSTSWRGGAPVVALLYLFDVRFLFGDMDSRMAQKYVAPVLNDPSRALLALPAGAPELESMRASFALDNRQWEYEYALRDALCSMWLNFQNLDAHFWHASQTEAEGHAIRDMISFINTHLTENLDVQRIAEHMHISVRSCYRIFCDSLNTTPNRYIQELRIHRACSLLTDPANSITAAALGAGFEDIGYFGRLFRKHIGMTPTEYRKWQNRPSK